MKGRRAYISLSVLLLTVMLIVIGDNSARAQTTVYPTSDATGTIGVCLFCDVTTRSFAYDNDLNTSSSLNLSVGVAGSVYQTLIFPSSSNTNCDEVSVILGTSASVLTANLLGGITIETFNGSTANNDAISVTVATLTILSGGNKGQITFKPTAQFDRVRIRLSGGVLGALNNVNVFTLYKLDNKPVLTALTPFSICNGQSVDLSTLNPTDTKGIPGGTYTWSLTQGGTALSSTTVTPSVTTTYWVRYSKGTCYDDKSIQITVSNPPTTSNAGTNQSLCSVTTTTLTGNTATTGTGVWSRVSGPNTPTITTPASATTTVTGMIAGTYVFRWTISNNPCPASTSDVTVVVGAPVTASNAGTTQNLCNATGTTLAGNTPSVGTGTWTVVSGPNTPVFTNPNSGTTTVTGMVPGNYVFQWTISSGSCPTSSTTVNINNSAPPTTAAAGTNQNLCAVTTATLAGNTPTVGTGVWTQISGPNTATITTPSANNSGLTGLIAGTYVFRWTISNSPCPASTSDVSITISATPTTASAGPNQLLCSATSATLAGNSAVSGTGAWSLVSGPNTPVITTPSAPGSTVTGLITGVYVLRWTISNGACTPSTSDVTITVGVTPAITLGTFPSACREITSATLAYTGTTGSPATYSITWDTPALTAGFTNVSNAVLPASPITITIPVSAPVAAYTGTIKVKNAGGCESSGVSFTLNVHPKPTTPSFSVTSN